MSPASNRKRYAVITADVVGSRKIESFRPKRDRRLSAVSRFHLAQKLILSPYTITAWDEFQVILREPEYAPRVIFDLRRLFYPFELWIAVGIGSVSEPNRIPVNQYAGGQALSLIHISTVSPSATTTYTLTATNATGSVTATAKVTVTASGAPLALSLIHI